MIEIAVQYLIPAVSLAIAAWDRKRTALWLSIGAFYGCLGLVIGTAERGSLLHLSLVMTSPLVYSVAFISLIIAIEDHWHTPRHS